MSMTRSRFCSALMSASAMWVLQACGGGGTDYGSSPAPSPAPGPAPGPAPAPSPQCGASGAAIVGNHGHVLVFDRTDLDAMTPQIYHIAGSAGHDHTVTFSLAQLQTLKSGGSVTVTSSFNGHQHDVTATCM